MTVTQYSIWFASSYCVPEGHQKENFTLAGIASTFPRSFHKESKGFMRFGAAMGSTLQRKVLAQLLKLKLKVK